MRRLSDNFEYSRHSLGIIAAILVGVSSVVSPSLAQLSTARQWNEELLQAIRHDFARPTIHARNLFHVSIAMYDAWAVYGTGAYPYMSDEIAISSDIDAARDEAISFAAYRIMRHRFASSPGAGITLPAIDAKMDSLSYDRTFTSSVGTSPAAVGNRIAETILAFGQFDGANESGSYENLFYFPVNPPLLPDFAGNPDIIFPNRWQPLALEFFVDQSGNPIPFGYPEFLNPEWGIVTPFALADNDLTIYSRGGFDYWVYHDPGPPPQLGGVDEDYYKLGTEQVVIWSNHLDPTDGVMWDVSPASLGNAPLPSANEYLSYYDVNNGGDWGTGYLLNPATGKPYTPQIVPRGDYTRILAEFWADGPDSETPPGHWFVILNYVSDHAATVKQLGGSGPILGDLEWDVKCYLAMGGAMHDAAIAAWGAKGWYDYIRPISAIRYLADLGQCTDKALPSFHVDGINLHPGIIEVITNASSAPGERHESLTGNVGKIAIKAWRGPSAILDPINSIAGVGWILAENWWPYQRPSFVTPPFAGYVSGHSTFSRAAAEVMTLLTGDEYFPGGLGEFPCPQNQFLVFEDGPSVNVTLQWAKYNDASDQCSLSRIWGGIHPPADDIPGRIMGSVIGPDAYELAQQYFNKTVYPIFFDCIGGPENNTLPGACPRSDHDRDGDVDLQDFAEVQLSR